MKELIGKTVTGLRVNSDQSVLTFDHPDGTRTSYYAAGDCCSETWFADITGVSALLGRTVATVEDVEMKSIHDGRTRQDSDEFYGVKMTTDKGHVDIVYRNSSNGYYGGDIVFLTPQVLRLLHTGEGSIAITDDWSA